MLWTVLRPLLPAVALFAAYLWLLTRIHHGGKGWPRLRRKRNRHPSRQHVRPSTPVRR